MFSKFKRILAKTRNSVSQGWAKLLGKTSVDEETLESLETLLLKADVGVNTTEALLDAVKKNISPEHDVVSILKAELLKILQPCEQTLSVDAKPSVLLMVGINGAGKTTTIAKLAQYFKDQNKKVLLAAGDTFRAAAIEQLSTWGARLDVPVVSQAQGSDSASVVFDAFQSARSKNIDVLLADTAGRLHTQGHLMEELKKIIRVLKKLDPAAPHKIILVLDASTGQNALSQVREFHQAVNLSGLILSKLDGTAKGGVVFALAQEFKLPIYFLGSGESLHDLLPFSAQEFVDGLFEGESL